MKNLYIYKRFVPCIAPALQEVVGGRVTAVLPDLENLFLAELQRFSHRDLSSEPLNSSFAHGSSLSLTSHPIAFPVRRRVNHVVEYLFI